MPSLSFFYPIIVENATRFSAHFFHRSLVNNISPITHKVKRKANVARPEGTPAPQRQGTVPVPGTEKVVGEEWLREYPRNRDRRKENKAR